LGSVQELEQKCKPNETGHYFGAMPKQAQPQWAEAIEHRFYGGLTLEETAHMMDVDERTIRRWWDRARPVLAQRILQLMNAEIPEEQRP